MIRMWGAALVALGLLATGGRAQDDDKTEFLGDLGDSESLLDEEMVEETNEDGTQFVRFCCRSFCYRPFSCYRPAFSYGYCGLRAGVCVARACRPAYYYSAPDYYYSAPAYYYSSPGPGFGLSIGNRVTLSIGSGVQPRRYIEPMTKPQDERQPPPVPPEERGPFQYNGGPKSFVPMPKAEPVEPAQGPLVSVPTSAKKFAYPAYGEKFNQDESSRSVKR